jgi:hypothetical protein
MSAYLFLYRINDRILSLQESEPLVVLINNIFKHKMLELQASSKISLKFWSTQKKWRQKTKAKQQQQYNTSSGKG